MDSKSINKISRELTARLEAISPRFLAAAQIKSAQQRKRELDACNARVVSETQSLLCSFLDDLSAETLASGVLDSTKKKNAFYSRNLSLEIISKYDFKVTPSNLKVKEGNPLLPILPAAGTLGIGTALSFALHSPIILPVALVLAVAVFFIAKAIITYCNENRQQEIAQKHLVELKEQILVWLRNIEQYFNSQIALIANGGIQ